MPLNRMLHLSGPDTRMDTSTSFFADSLNALPPHCPLCGFEDLDYLPERYLLKRGTASPSDMLLAAMGNLLVRNRAKKIIEAVAPNQCKFLPTYHLKGAALTEWHLAVPLNFNKNPAVQFTAPRCPVCNEPMTSHPGTQWKYDESEPWQPPQTPWEIAKSYEWSSSENLVNRSQYWRWLVDQKPEPANPEIAFLHASKDHKWKRYFYGRETLVSERFAQLMKKLRLKSLVPTALDYGQKSLENSAWVEARIHQLKQLGLDSPQPDVSDDLAAWFKKYLARQKPRATFRVEEVERLHHITLPDSYKTFCDKVGPRTFRNVDEEEGFDPEIHRPPSPDHAVQSVQPEGEPQTLRIYSFAHISNGDEFVFDLTHPTSDPPVLFYLHEQDTYEPYAANFLACLKRWTTR